MSVIKKCPNCGADNDLFFTNCQFCKSPLPAGDTNSISNEDLITNAGEWVGKVGTSFTVTAENTNAWTGKGIRTYQSSEIEGYALKYLSLLQVRATNNTTLKIVYDSLKNDFERKKSSVIAKIGGGDKNKGIFLIFFAVLAIVSITFFLLPSEPDDYEKEIKRLDNIETQVLENIKNKNYDNALILLSGMEYSLYWSGEGDSIPKKAWRSKREGYIRTIKEIKQN